MHYLILIFLLCCGAATAADIPAYENSHGRDKPVVAVVGENSGTELTDFVIPYGVMARSGAVQLLAVGTQPGALILRPALAIQPHADIREFDARFPDGADYVIVPAVAKSTDPALLAWVAAQGAKGATIVSICDGALVVANSGLLKGRRATAHWATEDHRKEKYPDTQWVGNTRYVVDGKIISSAGISAAMPTSLALLEAIAGREQAAAVAQQMGVSEWSAAHNSDAFKPRLGSNLMAYATTYTDSWFHSADSIGVPVADGVDEIALAYTADAWTRTHRGRVYAIGASKAPVQTRYGLTLLPDRAAGAGDAPDLMLPAPDGIEPGKTLDHVLVQLAQRYGGNTAYRVALEFEYPSYRP
jgi:putative intracellular protease/amidase